ncbi:MAG: Asp-tRNA(Asn)/Glu-tRNA(Gln) amidotransferase subunit GatC [Patescibacteria group bacterium]
MISIKEIEKLAELSRLQLSEEEKQAFQKDLESILGYIDQIQKVSADLSSEKKAGVIHNVLRDDTAPYASGMYTEILISAAPKRESNYLKVKKIL